MAKHSCEQKFEVVLGVLEHGLSRQKSEKDSITDIEIE